MSDDPTPADRVSKEPDFTDLIGELYQLAGAVLMAGDHYTTESKEELGTLLLDVLAAPDEWTADMVHAEWKARAVPSEAAQIQAVTATTGAATVKVFDPKAQAEADATIAALREALARSFHGDGITPALEHELRAVLNQAGQKEPPDAV